MDLSPDTSDYINQILNKDYTIDYNNKTIDDKKLPSINELSTFPITQSKTLPKKMLYRIKSILNSLIKTVIENKTDEIVQREAIKK